MKTLALSATEILQFVISGIAWAAGVGQNWVALVGQDDAWLDGLYTS